MVNNLQRRITGSRWAWFLQGLPILSRAFAMFKARKYTMTSPARCRHLWDMCSQVLKDKIPGSFVECGVWKGGSSAMVAMAIKNAGQHRHLHLFDSFEGLPAPTEKDGESAIMYSGGQSHGKLISINQCEASLDEVRHLILDKIKASPDLIHFHVGWFQNTVPLAAQQIGPIALLRLDGDWYDSTKICLEHLYPLLTPGGIIILDDYLFWKGCRKATDEYRNQNQINCPIQPIDKDAVFWVKI